MGLQNGGNPHKYYTFEIFNVPRTITIRTKNYNPLYQEL